MQVVTNTFIHQTVKILSRYIFKESLAFFCIALFAFTAVLLTVQMLRFTSLIINKGVGFYQIAAVFVSIIPTFMEIAIPMAALLGVMLAFARLSGDSEIVVMRSSGVSLFELVKPVAIFALFIIALSLIVSVSLRPWGYKHLNQTLFEIARSRSTAGLDAGVFSKLGNLTIYTEAIDHHTGLLSNVVVDDKRNIDSRSIIVAKSGHILSDENARTITFHLFDGDIHEIVDKKYVVTTFDTNSLEVSSDDLLAGDKKQHRQKSQEMSANELQASMIATMQQIEDYQRRSDNSEDAFAQVFQGKYHDISEVYRKVQRLQIEAGRRYSIPFASFLLVFLGMPLGVHPPRTQRTWGIGLSIILGLLVFVVYYGFLSIGMALAEAGRVSAVSALWTPNIVVLLTALFFSQRVASERWQSIAEGIIELLQYAYRNLRRKFK